MSLTTGKRVIRNKWTVLPMPAEVIATVHQLAAACKKYKGIVFTDKNGNIINDDDDDGDENNTSEITGVDDTNTEDMNNTEMETNNNNTLEITGVNNNNNTLEITGVNNNTAETAETETETIQNINNEPYTNTDTYINNQQDDTGNNHEEYDDEVSIEDESPEDIHITINDINTVHEMNAGQLHIDPDTGEEMETDIETNTHRYSLRPRPTKRNQKYNMVNVGRQSTIAKPHLHVMLNQVGIKEGLKKFGEEGNNALLKELSQLHERDALLLKKKEDMTHEERKKALRYLMF